jgi:hypothetical protein
MSLVNLLEAVKQLDNDDLFAVSLSDDIEIVFRLPSSKWAGQIAHLLSMTDDESLQYIIYDYVFKHCVLDNYLTNFDEKLPAGVPASIGMTILTLSGADNNALEYTKNLMDVYRQNAKSTLAFMKRTICQTFFGYTFDLLDKLNYQQLVEIFINAEQAQLDAGIIKDRYRIETEDNKDKKQKSISQQIKEDMKEYEAFNSVEITQKDPQYDIKMRQREIAERQRLMKNLRG